MDLIRFVTIDESRLRVTSALYDSVGFSIKFNLQQKKWINFSSILFKVSTTNRISRTLSVCVHSQHFERVCKVQVLFSHLFKR